MTTDIAVSKTSFQVEDRGWLKGLHGTDVTPTVTLDFSTFVAGTHFPNGYVKSGTVLGKITASGKYGVYDSAASDGRQTAAGILFSSLKVPTDLHSVAGGMLIHGDVTVSRLPLQSGTGSATAAAQTALKSIIWL